MSIRRMAIRQPKPEQSEPAVPTVPMHSLAGLFASGRLNLQDEAAIGEIAAIRTAFQKFVVPSRGWMSPRYSTDNIRPVPRGLAVKRPWSRYRAFFELHKGVALPPSQNRPWGLSWAAVAVSLITEPISFDEMAAELNLTTPELTDRFIGMVRGYGRELPVPSDVVAPLSRKSYRRKRERPQNYPRHGRKWKKSKKS